MQLTVAAFYFNISSGELAVANFSGDTAVRVKDGGYLASLGVYHELHCLVSIPSILQPLELTMRDAESDEEFPLRPHKLHPQGHGILAGSFRYDSFMYTGSLLTHILYRPLHRGPAPLGDVFSRSRPVYVYLAQGRKLHISRCAFAVAPEMR